MTKFTGLVGYVTETETFPGSGIWSPDETPKMMKGDVLRETSTSQDDGKVNGNISLNHRVSLVGDAYAFGNYYNIKWIDIDFRKWEVTSVEIRRPRIIVTLGGLWNGS